MTETISLSDSPEGFDADLWGAVFAVLPPTRSVLERLDPAEDVLIEAQDGKPQEQVDAICTILDIRLKPTGDSKKKASKIVEEKWKADEVTLIQLYGLLAKIGEATNPPL